MRRGATVGLLGALVVAVSAGAGAGAGASPAASVAPGAATTPIQHVVLLYQENHTFDNVLGDLCVVDARCNGSISPVKLKGGTTVTPHVATDIVPPMAHTVKAQTNAIDGGKMDGWASVSGCQAPDYACLAYYTPSQIPALAALARKFVISDRTFQPTYAPSWGAHLAYASGGTLDGFRGDNPLATPGVTADGWGCDSKKRTSWTSSRGKTSQQPSCVPDPATGLPNGGAFAPTSVKYVPTIMDRLNAAGLTWKLYTPQANQSSQMNGYQWAICPTFAECLDTSQVNNMVPMNNVLTDAANGTLPTFSVVTPELQLSQHNQTSMMSGDNWIGQVVSAIENGPDWLSTAIFITYDDCGCFYDHVGPPQGEGIRAPMVIVSPYARAGFTDPTRADDVGSVLAYLEHDFSLAPLTAADKYAYYYNRSFNYRQTPIQAIRLPAASRTAPVNVSPEVADDPT